ncbi:hypothetical protein ATO6_11050 [Oceanicola sp. 22II-s10i]|uniref:DUF1697 domain-containing protein n=1 Tax=Oceanicola sp. 22II-s10i TaxID=1317116 RepID=UPI000B51EAE8|nr:DUF1697 domain-containing protein [Oceanicola sp. 22II-s10i]OWU84843.1 hypothetical protein ATO6_11050 [Oceanicola sp. 22II-s10i]
MRWVVLLRAVNVGGTGKLPMTALRDALAQGGAENVATYIQSGNILMDIEKGEPREVEGFVMSLVETQFGFRPGVMAFRPEDIDAALSGVPWPDVPEPKHVHLMFFTATPAEDALSVLEPQCTQDEVLVMGRHCLYAHTPEGLGKSKLNGRIEKAVGCAVTARNLNSVRKIRDLV